MTTFSKDLPLKKAFFGIIETFDGINISSISKDANAKSSIICKFESVGICQEGFSEKSNCNEYIEGYYYDNINESCIYCGNGCSKCINSNQCIEFLPGFDIKSNCKICESIFFATINGSTKHLTCTYCGDGCASCSSTSKCDSCKEGYSQSTNCNQCIDGYYKKNYLSVSFECISCGRGSATWKTSRTCDTYKDNFINEQDCEVGYFVHDFNNGTVICDIFSENCEEGYSNPENLGKDCINGYYKDTSTENPRCLSCPTNCLLCTSATQCTQCKIGNSNSESNSICNACDTSGGYIVVSTNGSTPVFGHECENDNDCSENAVCNSNSCVCKLGYIGENCLQCATGFTRSSSSQCDTCDTGFYKQEDGNCSPCSCNCVNCSSNSIYQKGFPPILNTFSEEEEDYDFDIDQQDSFENECDDDTEGQIMDYGQIQFTEETTLSSFKNSMWNVGATAEIEFFPGTFSKVYLLDAVNDIEKFIPQISKDGVIFIDFEYVPLSRSNAAPVCLFQFCSSEGAFLFRQTERKTNEAMKKFLSKENGLRFVAKGISGDMARLHAFFGSNFEMNIEDVEQTRLKPYKESLNFEKMVESFAGKPSAQFKDKRISCSNWNARKLTKI